MNRPLSYQSCAGQVLSGYYLALANARQLLKLTRLSYAQCGLHQIALHHIDNHLNKLHEAVTKRRTENVPATAENNGGVIFLATFRFRLWPVRFA